MISLNLQPLRQFRQQVYQVFSPGRDAAFEIMDAISDSPHARSVVEVSLAPGMQRQFSSVYKGLERTRMDTPALPRLLVRLAEDQECFQVAGSAIYALDHTPYPRRAAPTVSDRGLVRAADRQVIGHQYSRLGRVMPPQGSWLGVTDCERIPTLSTPVKQGAQASGAAQASEPWAVHRDRRQRVFRGGVAGSGPPGLLLAGASEGQPGRV